LSCPNFFYFVIELRFQENLLCPTCYLYLKFYFWL
jgi:hypothetical protein